MARRGDDPFRAVAARLDGLSCERSAIRPDQPMSLGKPDDPVRVAARVASERLSAPCRKAFEQLFGLDLPPQPWE